MKLILIIALAIAVTHATDTQVQTARNPVYLQLCPRSPWDPEQTYSPTRVVATMPFRVCTAYDVNSDTCTAEHMAWSIAVSRNKYITSEMRQYAQITLEKYGGSEPHLWDLYHTTDNRTYVEQCVTERYFWPVPESPQNLVHRADQKLVKMAQVWGMTHQDDGLVLRWGYGRLWPVPEEHWTEGERALRTGTNLETSTQTNSYYDSPDIIPLHYELE